MSEKSHSKNKSKEGAIEKGARWYRNVNALGAFALGGAALIAPPILAVGLGALAGVNALQAAGGEGVRIFSKNRRIKKRNQAEKG